MIVDYHMHLRDEAGEIKFAPRAVGPFVETAIARGVAEIGFTEHVYYFERTRHLWSMPYHLERCAYDIEPYVEAVVEAKRRGYPVKLGIEVDYEPGLESETAKALDPYPWDYVLGSIHFLDGLAIDQEPSLVGSLGEQAAWSRYYETLAGAARSGLFDSLAHPDIVKFFGDEIDWDWGSAASSLNGVALEVSSAGLHKPHGKLYPNGGLLAAAKEQGMPITLASDAHVPQNVGRDLDRAIEHARAAGYETVTVFEERNARQEPLG